MKVIKMNGTDIMVSRILKYCHQLPIPPAKVVLKNKPRYGHNPPPFPDQLTGVDCLLANIPAQNNPHFLTFSLLARIMPVFVILQSLNICVSGSLDFLNFSAPGLILTE